MYVTGYRVQWSLVVLQARPFCLWWLVSVEWTYATEAHGTQMLRKIGAFLGCSIKPNLVLILYAGYIDLAVKRLHDRSVS